MNKIYDIIKNVLVYSVFGFILVPIKFIFWLLTPNAWSVLGNLPRCLKGGENVSLFDALKPLGIACIWLAIAFLSLGVFGDLTSGASKIMESFIVPSTNESM